MVQAARLALRQGICLKRQAARAGTGTAVAAASAQKGRHVALAADAHAQRAVHEALGLDAAVLCDMLHLGHAQLTGQHHAGEAQLLELQRTLQAVHAHLGGAVARQLRCNFTDQRCHCQILTDDRIGTAGCNGTDGLFQRGQLAAKGFIRHIHINHGPEIERSIDNVKREISKNENIRHKYSTRFLAIKLLENDKDIETRVIAPLPNGAEILAIRDNEAARLRELGNDDSEQCIADAKYGFISGALKDTFTQNNHDTEAFTRVVDSIVTNRFWGFPIFFIFLYIMFEGTFVLGEYPQQAIEWFVGLIAQGTETFLSPGPLKDLIIDGIIGGVGGVIVFLPNILLLYFFISFMEDSGYMARAAFIMDKIMHKMGLHGKSFIPLIMGFGCNVPAIMSSRIIESRKARLVTMLVNPLMSCSARLPIYLVMIGAFFPGKASLILLSIYAIGILLAVLMARIFTKFLVKGDDSPFVMELPPYRMPTAKVVLRHTWEKGKQYLKKMGGIIMVASIIIWFLGYYPNHEAYETTAEQQENSYIGQLGKAIEPAIEPLGFDWKMGIGILSGIGAKELVVSTLGVLYTNEDDVDSVDLSERIPITPLVAYGYMLFVLIYFPCIATLAAIKQESGGWKWAIFAATYTTVLAWIVSFGVYQIGSLFI